MALEILKASLRSSANFGGGELGSTYVIKVVVLPGMIPPMGLFALMGHKLSANDNVAPVALKVAA